MDDKCKSCVDCGMYSCDFQNKKYPEVCVSRDEVNENLIMCALDEYETAENNRIMMTAAGIEHEYYCRMSRVEETVEFASRMGYSKIGIATCIGLIKESRVLAKILRDHGFEVYAVACKVGGVDKTNLGIPEEYKEVGPNICNPISQAMILNEKKTDMNIVMGLCVGHDMLFYQYAEAPTTTLVVKDRVTGHNPAAVLYTADSYYKKKL
ncbi:MAG: DUF1847 domain-containing protein [Bacillota bacterium]|nr:DUF1847 domain-containing protein [Bacillota bacterium]